MKKIFLLMLSVILVNSSFGQKAVATHNQIETFYKTTTCVVLDDDIFNTYNSAIQTAVEQSWTVTPFKFISMKEFKDIRQRSEYSFLIRTKVFSEKHPDKVSYTFLSLVVGEIDKNFEELPEICSFPLSYYNVDYEKYDYKIGALLLFIQNHIEITYNDESLSDKNILHHYNKNISNISEKEIYLNKENIETAVNSESKISKIYSGKVKIVDSDEIQKAIDEKNEDVIILHIVTPPDNSGSIGKCYKMLIGAADGKLYYYDAHSIKKNKPGKFLKSDFTNLKN
jgi:hypothetical protein